MADYLILKRKPGDPRALHEMGIRAWDLLALQRGFTADVPGATQALKGAYNGPGRYGVVRADNARTAEVDFGDVTVTEDDSPEWQAPDPNEEVVE